MKTCNQPVTKLKLFLATSNPGKLTEYRHLLGNFQIVTHAEMGLNINVAESATTYEENARLKGITAARLSQLIALADDSGLEVDALGGKPGSFSARFAGTKVSDTDRVSYLLSLLKNVPWEKRTARFVCVIAVATPDGEAELFHGDCPGFIAFEPRGSYGFGYDPIFYLPQLGKTMAELPLEVKNQISHRGQAVKKALKFLEELHARAL